MKCGIVNCNQNDNRFLWQCHGTCKKKYHAACIGVQRHHEQVLRTFMLPLCADCQELFIPEPNLKELASSLNTLTENMDHTLSANHKLLANFERLSATHDETLDHVDKVLGEIKQSISVVASSSTKSAAEMKNKLSALLDTPPADTSMAVEKAVKSAALAAAETLRTTTTSTAQSIERLPQLFAELKDELKDATANLTSGVKTHLEELAKNIAAKENLLPENSLTKEPLEVKLRPGWRFLGGKKIWKHDWTHYDIKMRVRHQQEKLAEKARRRKKQRRRKQHNQNITNISNNNKNNNNNNCNIRQNDNNVRNAPLPLDKELLAAARIQFSRAPLPASSEPKFINFQKGETLNPYPTEKSASNVTTSTTTTATSAPKIHSSGHPPLLDPMRPPIVRLTEQSAAGDLRFLKARLRDPKIMDTVRTYLSFLHDQPASVCIRGITKTSATLSLAAEGLPTDIQALGEIFLDVHEELGIPRKDALADLHSHRQFLTSERTHRLQQLRDSTNQFYSSSPGNFFRK